MDNFDDTTITSCSGSDAINNTESKINKSFLYYLRNLRVINYLLLSFKDVYPFN